MKYSKNMHPREEHLIPLFVNLGACEGKVRKNLKLFLTGAHMSNFILN
jgi:aromatic ring-opening dioxygenase catalytic subunit (LigB family)